MDRRRWLRLWALWPAAGLAKTAPPARAEPALSNDLSSAWEAYARRFVTADGRAVDTGNQGITHTEGLGVSMLVAQACGDRERFDRLWTFSAKLKRPDGLSSWRWEPGKGVSDANNATDGDLYLAWALLRAGKRWNEPRHLAAAAQIARAVREQLLIEVRGLTLLLPGKDGFLDDKIPVVNPSYLILPALAEMTQVDDAPPWRALHASTLNLLATARFGPERLPADWLWMGDPVKPWSQRPARFGYEAIRIPLFLAWSRQSSHPALLALAAHFKPAGFPAWVDLATPEVAPYAAPAGFQSVAALVRAQAFGTPPSFHPIDDDYYSSSLSLLARLAWQDVRGR